MIQMTGRRGRRCKQLLDDLKENRKYWKLKEEVLDRTLWRTRFGRGYGPVIRQTTEWMNIPHCKFLRLHSVHNRLVNAWGTLLECIDKKKRKYSGGKSLRTYTLSTTNPTWACLGLGLSGVKEATKRLSQGTV
jgi:hypothetical protein